MHDPNEIAGDDVRYAGNAAQPVSQEANVRYVIDSGASTFLVQASSTGLLSAFGHDPKFAIGDFQGDAEFTPGSPNLDDARVRVRVRADSLKVVNEISESDRDEIERRMNTEVLESDRFPDVYYEVLRVTGSGNGERYWLALDGELTMRGVTRHLAVSARLLLNGGSLRGSGEFSVKLSDFGIAPVTAVGGAIRLKDELKCSFDVVARKQE
ncbi:MAG TPA: YceI family protein [Terriglobales bacterium]|nr:YceI family protein [Terriglobales bacterium]